MALSPGELEFGIGIRRVPCYFLRGFLARSFRAAPGALLTTLLPVPIVPSGAARSIAAWSPDQTVGLAKGSPQLHPLLRFSPNAAEVTLTLAFVDVTKLFLDIHGDTPWYRALELLKGTARTISVLASLRGHPLIWYVVIPQGVAAEPDLKPVVLYYPADYGGITYDDSLAGIKSPTHDTSVGNTQCGGETLVSFLTKPLSADEYDSKLDAFVAMRERFKKRQGRNPPPLHHYRSVLSYHTSGAALVPDYWNVPFGFEAAIAEHKKILQIPQDQRPQWRRRSQGGPQRADRVGAIDDLHARQRAHC